MNLSKYYPIAQSVAGLSKDPNTKVGALVIDKRGSIRAVGYNGFPRGVNDDPLMYADRETKLRFIAHAEANAIANAASTGTPLQGCSLVVTKFPCRECAKMIINAGISHIFSPAYSIMGDWASSNYDAQRMFMEAGLTIEFFDE